MIPNRSPWIKQLDRTRPVVPLAADVRGDVAIVGGGIAGAMTAYFVLRDTARRVTMLEAGMVAHGATGHNAGQITSYFERPLHELAEEFGLDLAVEAQRDVESSWGLIEGIFAAAKLRTPLHRFVGHAGVSDLRQLMTHLKDNRVRALGGLPTERIRVAEDWDGRAEIPKEYTDLYALAPRAEIMGLIETRHGGYVASVSYGKGCMNSALFTEEVIGYLLKTYPDRFVLYEGTPVASLTLGTARAVLAAGPHRVTADRVVLCTNGFEEFSIINAAGRPIDASFHHSVTGRIGYMSGYLDDSDGAPTAISYFTDSVAMPGDPTGESYYYLTRRPFESGSRRKRNLVCAGGPEKMLPNGAAYSREDSCSDEIKFAVDDFLQTHFARRPEGEPDYEFCWHGLMGYTPSGVRMVGPEPLNPVLLYNLGCNGVGIMTSVFGGKRIAKFLSGAAMKRSLFDPRDQSAAAEAERAAAASLAPRSPARRLASAALAILLALALLAAVAG